ncbi:hypothetical protein Tco_0256724 [Tanacetum coccineum]
MSETEPIPPTSSVTALRIPIIKKEVKGSTLKQSTAEPAHIPKGYTQAISSKVPTAPNCVSYSDEIICSFFAQQASMPITHDDEDLLQIDEDAMEEIDIRWQVAMKPSRIRNLCGRQEDPLTSKKQIFAKYQENRAKCRNEKVDVAIEDSNSKALWQQTPNEDIDWTKNLMPEPVPYA